VAHEPLRRLVAAVRIAVMGTRAQSEPQAATAPATVASPSPSARSALELAGLVVAPTTLVTALAFYFGWVLTNSRASYFGIDASALGFSTQDYLLRSADALFVPLGTALVLALGVVWLQAYAGRQLADRGRRARLRLVARVAVAAGGVLFALGAFAVFRPLSFSPHYLFASASPGIGIALVGLGLHLLGRVEAAGAAARCVARRRSHARHGARADRAADRVERVLDRFALRRRARARPGPAACGHARRAAAGHGLRAQAPGHRGPGGVRAPAHGRRSRLPLPLLRAAAADP